MNRPTVIYCGWAEQPVISALLLQQLHAVWEVRYATHHVWGVQLPALPCADYLISCGPAYIPLSVLTSVRHAINLHPAPPCYPGRGGAIRAICDRATTFGVTAHRMTATRDAGPIVQTLTFAIPPAATGSSLHALAVSYLPRLLALTLNHLPPHPEDGPPVRQAWTGKVWRSDDIAQLLDVTHCTPAQRALRLRAFDDPTKPRPYVRVGRERYLWAGKETGHVV